MNWVIKRELEKIRAPLPEYNDDTTLIEIQKEGNIKTFQFEEGSSYVIKLADYILNEPPNFTLSSNWNKGVIPRSKYLIVEVTKLMGKMLQVNGSGYDIDDGVLKSDTYMGLWLPCGGVEMIDKL